MKLAKDDHVIEKKSIVELPHLSQRQPDLNRVHRLDLPQSEVRGENASNVVRWAPGERLNHLIEEVCIRFSTNDAIIDGSGIILSYRDLNRCANQLARHLLARGIKSGDRVALMFDRSPETYVAMLAVMKVHAAYVPLDAAFPIERIRFILKDANVSAIVSMSTFAKYLSGLQQVDKIFLDSERPAIDAQQEADDLLTSVAPPIDPLCYIIYTSGTTGNPKGVGIEHASICNFVRVAAELYGYAPGDRVYQGMTIAFDFSVEEIWVSLMAGATLVPGPAGMTLMGDELGEFLRERRVTVMACCPTLLATIEQDVPDLRILLVGGEACPQNLVARWYRPYRRILNTYGPTEATVTATMTELRPDKPVTIGVPLPTYSIVILDPQEDKTVPTGELGEIGIAGIGLALGYINRDDLTMKKFIPDFLHIEKNPSGRIYRTGDLGRIDENGEIDYRGRIDGQVKIRGYRIELKEIEEVLLNLPQVSQAAVTTFEPQDDVVEIVGYYALKQGVELPRSEILQALRSKLPIYMVPSFLEQVDAVPMTLSNKADFKRLPKPPQLQQRFSNEQGYVPPKTDSERMLHAALVGILRVEHVSTEHHFFDDLGANSLLMARFCAAIRRNPSMSNISMRDIYMHPTIAKLAHHLDSSIDERGSVAATKPEPFHVPSTISYVMCGALQIGFFAVYTLFGLWFIVAGYYWVMNFDSAVDLYARSVALGTGLFVVLTSIPITAKWLLIGRFKAQSIPIWSFAYFRFWVVKTLIRASPVAAFIGTPLYNAYLRLLGARIGRNVILNCRCPPVCTDLVTIGDNTIVRKDTILLGYRAQSNFIHMGPVAIGSNSFVGEASVLDIDTAMGDNTQLGHASSLQSGQRVPDGKHYHGSPAVETSSDFCPIEVKNGTALRAFIYVSLILATPLLIAVPMVFFALAYNVWELVIPETIGFSIRSIIVKISIPSLLVLSAVLFFGALSIGLAVIYVIPRLCMIGLRPGVTYPNFGFHYLLQSIILGVSNSQFFCWLFGDSSFIVTYMRYVGWNLNTVHQTGSNMGTTQRHDNPFLCNIGSGTMVSDGLSMINMQMSATSFRLAESKIGDNNYLGNDIFYPPNGRTGTNVLFGTKTMVPIDGPVHENVGLLGSPAFEIPRMVDRDRDMNASFDEQTRLSRLRRKNMHNLITALLFLASRWVAVFIAFVIGQAAFANYDRFGFFAFFAGIWAITAVYIAIFILLERASLGFKRLQPQLASIYDPYFWWHERHWKLMASSILPMFAGTPFSGMLLRALGMKVGAKLFDCSLTISEHSLTEVGDYANLNEGCSLQAHSLEEGVFKSDHIRLGNRCSIGPGAFVHYGVSSGDHVVLDADSFLMKGEMLDSHTGWCGNPAKLARRHVAQAAVCVQDDADITVRNESSSRKPRPSRFARRGGDIAAQ